jgi:pimeloyl-ACP methyl ester carboxylesterase
MNVLLIHGNGGSPARFDETLEHLRRLKPKWHFAAAELSGFGEKELPEAEHYWNVFLGDVFRAVEGRTLEPWCFFGHGAGAAVLLELAQRGWEFPNGYILRPRKTILYGGVGSAGERSLLYRTTRLAPFRRPVQWLLQVGFLRKMWSKRLFVSAATMEPAVRDRFFGDIGRCRAFPLMFALISSDWREEVRKGAWHQRFHFSWGGFDRINSPASMDRWKTDFPRSEFRLHENWGHFPMLEDPEGFAEFLVQECR